MGDYENLRYPRRILDEATKPNRVQQPGRTSSSSSLPMGTNGPYKGSVFGNGAELDAPSVKYKTGSAYADKGVACDQDGAQGCFLEDGQRQRLISLFQNRVNNAGSQYLAAVLSAEIQERFKKEPEKVDWAAEILIDVISMVTIKSLGKAFHMMLEGAAEGVTAEAAHEAALHTSPEHMLASVEPFITAGKKTVYPPQSPEDSQEKTANLAYLDILKAKSAAIYEGLRENALAGATDGQIVMLFEAFRSAHHNTDVYKAAIVEKLERFSKTSIKALGTKKNEEYKGTAPYAYGLDAAQWHETKAFWVVLPNGKRHLGIYKRGHHGKNFDTVRFGPAGVGERPATPVEHTQMMMQDLKNNPFGFYEYVPSEFTDVAVAMHTAQWGSPPTETPAGQREIIMQGTAQ